MDRHPSSDLSGPIFAVILFVLASGFVLWLSAQVTSLLGNGQPLPQDNEATKSVFAVVGEHRSDPALAWSDPSIQSATLYWIVTAVITVLILALIHAGYTRFSTGRIALAKRDRLGTSTEAALATHKELAPLVVDGFIPDRFALGKIGRRHLAAENRHSAHDPGPTRGRAALATGDRGPVMFVGPTRSGKTVGVISSILTWGGPVIAASVKGDLIEPTLARRRTLGQTGIFDPTQELRSGYRNGKLTPTAWDERLCVNWSPLAGIKTFSDASRVAANLTETAPGPSSSGGGGNDFWIKSAEEILAPLLWIAALRSLPFSQVVDWAGRRPEDAEAAVSQFRPYFMWIKANTDTKERTVDRVADKLYGKLALEDRALDGVFMTLQTVLQPWATDEVADSASGKTVGVISSILTWGGPVIAASVKGDLIEPTLARRRTLGQTGIFDPTQELRSGYRNGKLTPTAWDERLCVNWSPLAGIKTFSDASRVAANLTETAPGPSSSGGGGNDFWIKSAEEILAPLLWIAALRSLPFSQVVDWAGRRPEDAEAAVSQFRPYFMWIKANTDTKERTVDRVADKLYGKLALEDRALDGVFMTLQTVLQPWATDEVADSASGASIDLEWLLAGGSEAPRSFYLSAPPSEAKRLKAVYGGAISELMRQVYTYTNANGPIEPPLLVVIDEAANMPLPLLQEYTSTLAGLGVQLVTVWQDFGQLYGHYGENVANAIIGNHLSRLFFRGLASPETAKWIEQLTGQEEVENTRTSLDTRGEHQSFDSKRLAILPANVVRQQTKFEALLVHGGLPPAHIRTHQWFNNKQLAALNEWKPEFDPDLGLPTPTAGIPAKSESRTTVLPFTPPTDNPPTDAQHEDNGHLGPLVAPEATITLPPRERPKGTTPVGPSIGIGNTP